MLKFWSHLESLSTSPVKAVVVIPVVRVRVTLRLSIICIFPRSSYIGNYSSESHSNLEHRYHGRSAFIPWLLNQRPMARMWHDVNVRMTFMSRSTNFALYIQDYLDRVKRIWYLSPMRAAKDQASLSIRAVSPEPPLLAHTSSESRGTFRQKARSLAPLNNWACAVKICHDGMLEDTNSLDGLIWYMNVETLG